MKIARTSSAFTMKAYHYFFSLVSDQKTWSPLPNSRNLFPGAALLSFSPDSNLFYKHLCSSLSSSPIPQEDKKMPVWSMSLYRFLQQIPMLREQVGKEQLHFHTGGARCRHYWITPVLPKLDLGKQTYSLRTDLERCEFYLCITQVLDEQRILYPS